MDLAASIQKVTEEVMIKIAKSIAKETGEKIYVLLAVLHLIVLQTEFFYVKKSLKIRYNQLLVMLVAL